MFLINGSLIFAGELNLEIRAQVNHHDTSFTALTNTNAVDGLDNYDARFKEPPETNYSYLVSVVSSTGLVIDAWDATSNWNDSRTILLKYFAEEESGTLDFTWDSSDVASLYTATLYDYGDDSTRTNQEGSSVNMSDDSSLSVTNSAANRYLSLVINYSQYYCGDGICNASLGETCSSCSGDCGVCTSSSSSSGSSGGGGDPLTISMVLEMPESLTVEESGVIEIPFVLKNDGGASLTRISLNSYVKVDGEISSDLEWRFSQESFDYLNSGDEKNLTYFLTISSGDLEVYQVFVNVSSEIPEYLIEESVFLNFIGKNELGILKTIVFTEGMINENAECYELRGLLEEARTAFDSGENFEALKKAQEALEACQDAIDSEKAPSYFEREETKILAYLSLGFGVALLLGIAFNIYRVFRFRYLSKKRRHKLNAKSK